MPSRTSSTPQTIWAKNKALYPDSQDFFRSPAASAAGDFHYSAYLHVLDDEGNYSEKLGPAAGSDFNRFVGRIFRQQAHFLASLIQSFYGEFTMYGGYDDSPVGYSRAAVYDQHIAIVYSCSCHAVAASPHKVSGCRVSHTELVQIQGAIQFASRRRGEACSHAFCKKWYS